MLFVFSGLQPQTYYFVINFVTENIITREVSVMNKFMTILITMIVILTMLSCTNTVKSDNEAVNMETNQGSNAATEQYSGITVTPSADSASDEEMIDTVNLPEEFYMYRNFKTANTFSYMNTKRCDFDVKEETTLKIKSEIDNGSLSLMIKTHGSDEVIYEAEDLKNVEDSVTLQPGKYSLVLKGSLAKGYLHITSG